MKNIRPRTLPIIVFTSLLACLPTYAAGYGPVPPDSFLQYSVGTVPELGKEVTISPLVRARLARHFHVSYAEIGRYVLHDLTLSTLEKAGAYRVACIRPDGHEYWIRSRLPAGTPVFTSRITGEAILKLACGNPMAVSLPQEPQDQGDGNSKMAPPEVSQTPPTSNQTPDSEGPVLMTEAFPSDSALLTNPLPPETEELLNTDPTVKTAGSLELAQFSPIQALADLGPILAATAAIAAVSGSHGHNGTGVIVPAVAGVPSDGTSPVQVLPPIPPTNPVPETSTSAAFGAMLLLGGITRKFRRKDRA